MKLNGRDTILSHRRIFSFSSTYLTKISENLQSHVIRRISKFDIVVKGESTLYAARRLTIDASVPLDLYPLDHHPEKFASTADAVALARSPVASDTATLRRRANARSRFRRFSDRPRTPGDSTDLIKESSNQITIRRGRAPFDVDDLCRAAARRFLPFLSILVSPLVSLGTRPRRTRLVLLTRKRFKSETRVKRLRKLVK